MNRRIKERFSLTGLTKTLFEEGRRPVVPLMGYPGLQLTRTTIKQNQFNHIVQYQSLSRLYDHYRPDAMFFLMDLSVEASALGLAVRFPLSATPSVEDHPVKTPADLDQFRRIDILGDGRVNVYLETLQHMRVGFPCPTGAFVIGPLTLAGLLLGANELAMSSIVDQDLFNVVLDFSWQVVMRYASEIKNFGADMIMVLEPTAVIFGPDQFRKSLSPLYREMVGLFDDIEILLHVCGDTTHLAAEMAQTGVAGLSLDSLVDFRKIYLLTGPDVMLMGNVSPVTMLTAGDHEVHIQAQSNRLNRATIIAPTPGATEVYDLTGQLLDQTSHIPLMVLSTGCDLPQDVPLESIEAFFRAGRSWRREERSSSEDHSYSQESEESFF